MSLSNVKPCLSFICFLILFVMKWNCLKVWEAKRLMGLIVHQDDVKPVKSLEWWSVVASPR